MLACTLKSRQAVVRKCKRVLVTCCCSICLDSSVASTAKLPAVEQVGLRALPAPIRKSGSDHRMDHNKSQGTLVASVGSRKQVCSRFFF